MKRVLVLGGSKGLGKACVDRFISSQEYVVHVMSRSGGENSDLLKHVKVDFFDLNSLSVALDELEKMHFDVIINNSGGPESKAFSNVTSEDFLKYFISHLLTAHEVVRKLSPGMIKNKKGRILNIISVTANNPLPNMIVSNTIRGAMVNWSKTLSKELASSGVTVNNLLPGYTNTERLSEVIQYVSEINEVPFKKVEEGLLSQIPKGRFGKPEELAEMAFFLASDKASYITGESISIDGGWTPCI